MCPFVFVCMCVCERERGGVEERETESERFWIQNRNFQRHKQNSLFQDKHVKRGLLRFTLHRPSVLDQRNEFVASY